MSQVKGMKGNLNVAGPATETGRYGEETLAFAISAFVNERYLNQQAMVIDCAGNSGL
jgi:hypothetical protein